MLNFYKKIIISLCLVFVGIFGAAAVQAQQIEFKPQVDIPGVKTAQVQPDGSTRAIGEYIKGIYNYGIGIVAILATAVMMFGGFQWIIAGGNAEKIGEAKAWLGAALTGLVLALGSFTILNLINPNLTSLKVARIGIPTKILNESNVYIKYQNSLDKTKKLAIEACKKTDKGYLYKKINGPINSTTCMSETAKEDCEFTCSYYTDNCYGEWGDKCEINGYNKNIVSYCYNETCIPANIIAEKGDPCGNTEGSICIESANCNDKENFIILGKNCNNPKLDCCLKDGIINP